MSPVRCFPSSTEDGLANDHSTVPASPPVAVSKKPVQRTVGHISFLLSWRRGCSRHGEHSRHHAFRSTLVGTANIVITADSRTWLGILAKEQSTVWAVLRFTPLTRSS